MEDMEWDGADLCWGLLGVLRFEYEQKLIVNSVQNKYLPIGTCWVFPYINECPGFDTVIGEIRG